MFWTLNPPCLVWFWNGRHNYRGYCQNQCKFVIFEFQSSVQKRNYVNFRIGPSNLDTRLLRTSPFGQILKRPKIIIPKSYLYVIKDSKNNRWERLFPKIAEDLQNVYQFIAWKFRGMKTFDFAVYGKYEFQISFLFALKILRI